MEMLIDIIASCVKNALGGVIKEKGEKWAKDKRTNELIDSVEARASEFIKQNENEYFNSSSALVFFESYKPIDRIFNNILGEGKTVVTKEILVADLCGKAKSISETEGRKINAFEEQQLRQLLEHIYDQINAFFKSRLTDSQKYLDAKTTSMLTSFQKSSDIQNEKLDSILDAFEKITPLSKEVEEKTAELLFSKMWKGQNEDIDSVSSLIVGKSKSLEQVIIIIKEILGKESISREKVEPALKAISNATIKDCIVSNLLPLICFNEEDMSYLSDYVSSEMLKQIITALDKRDYAILFSDSVEVENGLDIHTIEINKNTAKHFPWLSKQLLLIHIYKSGFANADNAMRSIDEDWNWLSFLMYHDKKIDSIVRNRVPDDESISLLKEIDQELRREEKTYNTLGYTYKSFYYELRLKISLLVSDGDYDFEQMKCVIPNDVWDMPQILDCMQLAEIKNGVTSIDDVLKYRDGEEAIWIILRYLQKLGIEERLPIIEEHRWWLELSPVVFFFYINALELANNERVSEVLNEYRDQYKYYYEYWRAFLRLESNSEEFLLLCEKNQLKFLSVESEYQIIKHLLSYERYDLAQRYTDRLEMRVGETYLIKKYKAVIKWGNKKYVDALEMFKTLFDEKPEDISIAESVIRLSILLKRRIESKYINVAESCDKVEMLVLASAVYTSQGDFNSSLRNNLKAMLCSDDKSNPAFSQYIALTSLYNRHIENLTHAVQGDTSVLLQRISDNKSIRYNVFCEKVLPRSPYAWNETINVYIDDAAALGLLNKKQEDTVVIDSFNYVIVSVESIYSYLTRASFEKIVANGSATAITGSFSNGKLDVDGFITQLKDAGVLKAKKTDWMKKYCDINEFPFPLFSIDRFYNCTYSQLVEAVLEDHDTFIRGYPIEQVNQTDNYILAFSTLIILKKAGVPMEFIRNANTFIPESAHVQIIEDTNEMIGRYGQEHVSSMGMMNGLPVLFEADENNKTKWLKEAGELRRYVETIPTVSNKRDLTIDTIEDERLENFIGVPDYDAIAISSEGEYTIVAAEGITSLLKDSCQCNYNTISIVSWLAANKMDSISLIRYISQMIKMGCCYYDIKEIIGCLIETTKNIEESKLAIVYEEWRKLLSEYENMIGTYKQIAIQYLIQAYIYFYENGQKDNPLIQILLHTLLHLLNIEHKVLADFDNGILALIPN